MATEDEREALAASMIAQFERAGRSASEPPPVAPAPVVDTGEPRPAESPHPSGKPAVPRWARWLAAGLVIALVVAGLLLAVR